MSSSTELPSERTWVSDVPLAMRKKSVMSDTPSRLSSTTSFALCSSRMDAARCAISSEVWAGCGTEAAMGSGMVSLLLVSGKSGARDDARRETRGGGPGTEPPPTGEVELLLDDPDANFWLHVGVQLDRHPVDAERLDRVVQVDQSLLDVEALRIELLGDVGRRDGAEQLAFLADARREGELHLLEPFGQLGGRLDAIVLGRLEATALLRDPLQVARRRFVGETARQQEVAGVSVLDRDDVAWLTQVLDRLPKNDFHVEPLITW